MVRLRRLVLIALVVSVPVAVLLAATAHAATAVLLELPPGVNARGLEAYLVRGSKAYPVLLVPAPSGVVGYKYVKDVRVGGLSVWKLPEDRLRSLAAGGAEPEIVYGEKSYLYHNVSSRRVLAVLPSRLGEALQPPAVAVARYRYGDAEIVLVPGRGSTELPPIGPGDSVAYSSYVCVGSKCRLVASYSITGADLENPATAGQHEIRLLGPRSSGLEPAWLFPGPVIGLWLVDQPPWEEAVFAPQGSLGPMMGRGGVHVAGSSPYSVSDTFVIPPRTTMYEVWAVITAQKPCMLTAILYIDGHPAAMETVSLKAGETAMVGASRQAFFGYLPEKKKVNVVLRIIPHGFIDVIYHVHAYARSYIGDSSDAAVYTQRLNLVGPALWTEPSPQKPSDDKIYIARNGGLILYLPVPAPFIEHTAQLTLRIEGARGQAPRHVKIYVGDVLACTGTTRRDPSTGLQVYTCRVGGPTLTSIMEKFLKTGRALPVKIDLGGPITPYTWWLEPGTALTVKTRARLYVKAWTRKWIPYAEASYPLSDMWSMSYRINDEWLQVTHLLKMEPTTTLADAAGIIAGYTPSHHTDSGSPLDIYVYLPVGTMQRQLSYSAVNGLGLVDAYVRSVEATIVVKYTGSGLGFGDLSVVDARLVGSGPKDEGMIKAMGTLSWYTGAASMIFEALGSALAAKLSGIVSLLLGFPSSFYSGDHLSYHVDYVYRKVCYNGGCGDMVEEAIIHVKAKPGWFTPDIGPNRGIFLDIEIAPPPGMCWSKKDSYVVKASGYVEIRDADHFYGGYSGYVRLPFSSIARFP